MAKPKRKVTGAEPQPASASKAEPYQLGSIAYFYDYFVRVMGAFEAYCVRTPEGGLEVPDANAAMQLSDLWYGFSGRTFFEFVFLLQKGSGTGGFSRRRLGERTPLHDALEIINVAFNRPMRPGDNYPFDNSCKREDRFLARDVIPPESVRDLNRAYKILATYVDESELRTIDISRSSGTDTAASLSPSEARVIAASDYTWLRVGRKTYDFSSGNQAKVIKALHREWIRSGERDGCGLSQANLGELIGSSSNRFRIPVTFHRHPALGTILRQVRKGVYALFLNEGPGS